MNNNIFEKKNKENNNKHNGSKILSKAINQNLSRKLQTSMGEVVRL
jgi:hypothetical protein